uniref:non-specific serine/threonine protein kinase n=1 Tax=Leersia perrieri TaxID=77586 RepID=A0A0D9V6G9_9ORYZ
MGISISAAAAGIPFILLLLLPSPAAAFSFTYNFTTGDTAPSGIAFQGDAFFNKFIRLTRDERIGPITSSAGRAFFSRPVPLRDPVSRRRASFSTAFSFSITAPDDPSGSSAASGDGLAFFLSPFPSVLPNRSAGGLLGLFNSSANGFPLVAVEFDTYRNDWDPSDDHVGVDLGGIVSAATVDWKTSMKDGRRAHARIAYDGDARNLTVALSYGGGGDPTDAAPLLWYAVDLTEYLPDDVAVGFSAATGEAAELHQVLYWEFTSTIDPREETIILWVVLGLCGFLLILVGAGVLWFVSQWRKAGELADGDEMGYDELADEEFFVESGPRRFRYSDLAAATRNFSDERKLGQGGFGAVYRGFLKDLGLSVAIKRVSKGSTQGRKEYAAEVRIISQLRHRHLVRLVGWCHEHRGDFLLVYELMPNGSVDRHLYGNNNNNAAAPPLSWPTRYNVAVGLASALLYLHEECPQCVVHRDVKPSNVMLDAAFSARLGDFGLAKLVDHGSQPRTTALAGTLGYLAPECVITGKTSRESDVYSFGVVALEVVCGRRPSEPEDENPRLVPWVWELYGKRAILEAADKRLDGRFDHEQMERVMVVGLWCAHPDYAHRPSIRQALNVLKFEAPLPLLPPKMPVPSYFPPPESVAPVSVGVTSSRDGPGGSECGSSRSNAGGGSEIDERFLDL